MAIITKVSEQTHNKNRVNVYLDGKFCTGLNMETAVTHGIREGEEIDEARLREISFDSDRRTLLSRGYEYLSTKPRTYAEMYRKMTLWGYGDPVIRAVLDQMVQSGYINDRDYADRFIEQSRDIGRAKILAKLGSLGIEKDVIDEAMRGYCVDSEVIYHLCEKFMAGKRKTADNIAKLVRHMMSKGFAYEDFRSIIDEYRKDIEVGEC